MRKTTFGPWLLIALLAVIACAPKVTPAPTAPPAPQVPAPLAPPQAPPSSEDQAWAKVVAAAKKEGRLTLYTWGWTGDIGLALSRAFKSRYGIDSELITGRGAEFLERLKTERRMGNIVADFVEGSQLHIRNMKLEGLTSGSADLPILREKGVWMAEPYYLDPKDKNMLGYMIFMLSPYINTQQVKPGQEPRSWQDILAPQWQGKLMSSDPNISNVLYYFNMLARRNVVPQDYVRSLARQGLIFTRGTADEAAKLARGEAAISVMNTAADMAPYAAEGAPIKATDMKEGVIVNSLGAAAIRDAPHPNAAHLLLNWLLTEEGQRVHGEAKRVASIRKGVADFTPQAIRLQPQNPIFQTVEDGEQLSRDFREKTLVPIFKK